MNSSTVDAPLPARLPGRRLALVVGANQTATPVPPPLRAAVADAEAMAVLDCCYAEDIRTGSDHRLDSLLAHLACYLEIPGAEVGKRQRGLRVALAATGYDQTAREDEEHGRMTGLILRGLRGEVLSLVNEEGGISLARLAEYLIKELSPEQKPAVFTSNATGQTRTGHAHHSGASRSALQGLGRVNACSPIL